MRPKLAKALRLLRRSRYRAAAVHGVAAAIEHERLLRGRGYRTVVDIGANGGQFAVLAAQLFPGARIFAFEPLAAPAARFERVMGTNGTVRLFRAAIGPEATSATMHVAARDDSSSLLPTTPLLERAFPDTAAVATTTVDVAPLDAFLGPDDLVSPSLLKIDVQGYELEVLKGCDALLASFDAVYVESSFVPLYEGQALASEMLGHLFERGFVLKAVSNCTSLPSGENAYGDFLLGRTMSSPPEHGASFGP